jgi:hypothetical protein
MNPDRTREIRLGSISAPDELAELWAIDKRLTARRHQKLKI